MLKIGLTWFSAHVSIVHGIVLHASRTLAGRKATMVSRRMRAVDESSSLTQGLNQFFAALQFHSLGPLSHLEPLATPPGTSRFEDVFLLLLVCVNAEM